jgi:hypothetical protein
MRRQPVEKDFSVTVSEDSVAVYFWPTRSRYIFNRFLSERDIAEFGPLSPSPTIRHGSRATGTGNFDSAEVMVVAFRLASAAVTRPGTDAG